MNVHPGLYEDDEPSGYDYENDHDTSEYCPNVPLVSTVKSALKPLYLLAAPHTFAYYDEVVNTDAFFSGSPIFKFWLGNVLCVV
jgi:hypothetical protein